MKTLNMQISLSTYQLLSDNGQLNPSFINDVLITAHANYSYKNIGAELKEPTVKYALKVAEEMHYDFKKTAVDLKITLSELSGRLFEKYYNEVK